MRAPEHDAGVDAWRTWAAHLQHLLGKERERAATSATTAKAALDASKAKGREYHNQARVSHGKEVRALERAVRAWERLDELSRKFTTLKASKERDSGNLDELEELLEAGDIPAAVDLLRERRAAIDAARARREAAA